MNLLTKLLFLIKRPKIIIVVGNGRTCAAQAIFWILDRYFKTKKVSGRGLGILDVLTKEILVFEGDFEDKSRINFLIEKSSLPILAVTHSVVPPKDKQTFLGDKEKVEQMRQLAKSIPNHGYLLLNFDDEAVRRLKPENGVGFLTFGFQEGADFQATDINLGEGTNFKISYKGNTVPFWIKESYSKEQIYTALAVAACGAIFGLNLVDISQSFKNG